MDKVLIASIGMEGGGMMTFGKSAEEFAREYPVPQEPVIEALEYVAANRTPIEQERDYEAARRRACGLLGPTQG